MQVFIAGFEGTVEELYEAVKSGKIALEDLQLEQVTDQLEAAASDMSPEAFGPQVSTVLPTAATMVDYKLGRLLPEPEEPQEEEEGPGPEEQLMLRLKEYERFRDVADQLANWKSLRDREFTAPRRASETQPRPLAGVNVDDLLAALSAVLQRVEEEDPGPATVQADPVTVEQRIGQVRQQLEAASGRLQFESLFASDHHRVEVVVTFLAVLELLRSREIDVQQGEQFGPILIVRRSQVGERGER